MKILDADQFRRVELETAQIQGIDMNDLMERAGQAVFHWLAENYTLMDAYFTLFCGVGNNGGDGLVIARLLADSKAKVMVYLKNTEEYSSDNFINQERLKSRGVKIKWFDLEHLIEIPKESIIIDALFGYGLNRPLSKEWGPFVNQINLAENQVISIDLPSGMFNNRLNSADDLIIESDVCLSFQGPKLAQLFSENWNSIKRIEFLNIGLDNGLIEESNSEYHFVDDKLISGYRIKRNRFSYKYNFGNVLVIGGSYGKIGAVHLTSKAVLRSGAGLVTACVPKCGYQVLQSSFPEAMLLTDFSEDKIISFPNINSFDTIAIGSGMGTDDKTAYAFQQFLEDTDLTNKKLVIDADGINLLAKNKDLLNLLPEQTIISPHDKELERLMGTWTDSIDKLEKLKSFSKKHHLILVSKGAFTQTVIPNGLIYFNSTGNSGMSTAGTGDVLTGIITGLLARGYKAKDAAILGVYLHGLCGDKAVEVLGEESLIASDLLEYLPISLKSI